MEKVKIAQVAKTLGVSLNSVYRKVKHSETKLNGHVIKENGVTFVSAEGVEILRGLFSRLNPSETPENKGDPAVSHLQEIIANQQRTIDTLISKHSEERARQAEERARADTIIMKLTQDVGNLQKVLEERKPVPLAIEPPKTIAPWSPEKPIDPLKSMTWYQRVWVQVFEPWRMRKYAS